MQALLSVEKVAQILGISHWTVRIYAKRGLLRPVRIGKRVLFQPHEVERFVAERAA